MSFQPDGEWVLCAGGFNPQFVNFLKFGIKPGSYRSYDARTKVWRFHNSWLPHVIPVARAQFLEVDWSALPTEWQLRIAGAQTKTRRPPRSSRPVRKSVDKSPYAVLFVVDNAPIEVVQASYKALAMKYHPDRAGDRDAMAKLNAAYDQIKKKKGCE